MIGSTSLGLNLSPLCIINLLMAQSTSALDQTIREFINVQVPWKFQVRLLKEFKLLQGLPKFREGMTECHLTPQEYGKYKGCVNWNMFYTNCNTGPHNPFHGAVSFDNIGLAWVAIFLVWEFLLTPISSYCIVKVISLEGWTDVMYIIQDTHSFYNFIYFVVLIIVSFDFINCNSS